MDEYENKISEWINNLECSSTIIDNEIARVRNETVMFKLEVQNSVHKFNTVLNSRSSSGINKP